MRLKWVVNDAAVVVDDAVMYRLMAGNSGKAEKSSWLNGVRNFGVIIWVGKIFGFINRGGVKGSARQGWVVD